jgi:hypothetical protein
MTHIDCFFLSECGTKGYSYILYNGYHIIDFITNITYFLSKFVMNLILRLKKWPRVHKLGDYLDRSKNLT